MISRIISTLTLITERYGNTVFHGAALFFLIGGMAYSFLRGECLNFPDERQYFAIAQNLASGNGFSLDGASSTALFPPVYPLVMAAFLKMGASIPLLRFMNFVFLTSSLYVIRSILRHERTESGVGLCALLMTAYGVLFYTAGTLYPQTLFTLILLLLVRCALNRNADITCTIFFGILCALLMAVHSTGVFIPPVAGLWIIFSSNDRKRTFKRVFISALVATACISLWTIRNYTVFHRFIPLTTHGGDTLYIGNNPHTSLSAWYDYVNDDYYQEASRLPEPEQNSYYLRKTFEFWTTQPGTATALYFRKLAEYFNYYNNLFVSSEFNVMKRVIMFISYYPLLACLIIRLILIKKTPLTSTEKLLAIIYIISALFHALFIPRIRFRLPYDVLLITHIGIMYAIFKERIKSLGSDPSRLTRI